MSEIEAKKAVNMLDGWTTMLVHLSVDMHRNGQDVLATHLESIVSDLQFQKSEIIGEEGPLVDWRPPCR